MNKKISNHEYNFTLYFLIRVFFLGIGISRIINIGGRDAWISGLLGMMIGSLILLIYERLPLKNSSLLSTVMESKFISPVLFIINNTFFILIHIIFLLVLQVFTGDLLLPDTPILLVIGPYIILAIYTSRQKTNIVFRLSTIFFSLSIILILFSFASLLPQVNYQYFTPVLITSKKAIIKGALAFASLSTVPYIFLCYLKENDLETPTNHKLVKPYLITSFQLAAIIFVTIGVLGSDIASVYRYPEYIILGRIKLLNFFEKVENIMIIIWLMDIFIALTVYYKFLISFIETKITNAKIANLIFASIIIFSLYFSAIYMNKNPALITLFYLKSPLIIGSFGLLWFLISIITTIIKRLRHPN